MELYIIGAIKDPLTREWEVSVVIDGKRYTYTLSDYDYGRAIREFNLGNYGKAVNILKS